jgi:hypothetical protein
VDCPDFDAALFDSYAEIGAGYEDMSGLRLVVQRSSRDALDGKEKGELARIVEAIRDYPRSR